MISLDSLFLLDELRELDVDGRNFATLLRKHEAKGHEVDNFLSEFPVVLPVIVLHLQAFLSSRLWPWSWHLVQLGIREPIA